MRQLNSFVDSFVRDHAVSTPDGYDVNFDRLSEFYKQEFAARLIEEDDRDLHYCICENDLYDDIVIAVINNLKPSRLKPDRDLATVLNESIVKHYEKKMRALINESCERLDHIGRTFRNDADEELAWNREFYYGDLA